MDKEATSMIDKESSDAVSGIMFGSMIGIAIWAIIIITIYSYLL